jgi:hypothetical protein
MGISRPVLTSISTIAIENYADVARRRLDANLTLKPDFVSLIEWAKEQTLPRLAASSALRLVVS